MMKINGMIIALLSFILLSEQSCVKDTCNDEPTFAMVEAILMDTDSLTIVNINWSLKKQLPKAYFDEIFTYESEMDRFGNEVKNSAKIIDTVIVNSNQDFDIFFVNHSLDSIPETFDFYFLFPDRRDFIDCTHAGSDDEYELELSISIIPSGDTLLISDLEWKENLYKGPI